MYFRRASPLAIFVIAMTCSSNMLAPAAAEPIPPPPPTAAAAAAAEVDKRQFDSWCCVQGCTGCSSYQCADKFCFNPPYYSCCAEGHRKEVVTENGTVLEVYNLNGEKMELVDSLE